MKLKEVFNVTAKDLGVKYYSSSFSGGQPTSETSERDQQFETRINVAHIDIEPQTEVNLVKNAKTIKTDSWENILTYLRDNFYELTGSYQISKGNRVLHSFSIT